MKKTSKKNKYLFREILFGGIGITVLVLPLLILIIVNREVYFQTETKESLSIGLVMILIVLVLQLAKFTKKWNSVVWLAVLAGILHFIRPILGDLELILWMACLGEGLYKPFEYLRDRNSRLRKAYEESKIDAEVQESNFDRITEAIENTLGR